MPSKRTNASPKSESRHSPRKYKPSASEIKRYENRFNFSEYSTDKSKENAMKKRLTSSEFRDLLRTISQDFENTMEVYKFSLTAGPSVKFHDWNKTLAKQYFTKCQKRLMGVLDYYKYRPPTTRSAAPGKQQLSQVFYVFQNFKDWVNEINMGTGLANLLISKKNNSKDPEKELYDVSGFIRDANTKLSDETSVKEIHRLLNFHVPSQVADEAVAKYVFDMKGDNVSKEDKHFKRILEIHNAYREANGMDELSADDALKMVVPQRSVIGSKKKSFNVQDVLDVQITTNDGTKHQSAAIVSAMSGIFMTLMAKANRIQETTPGYTKYVHYEILERYFAGSDQKQYPAGRGVGFYLDGEDQTDNLIADLPKASKRFNSEGVPTDATRKAVKNLLEEKVDSKDSPAYINITKRMYEATIADFTAMTYVAGGGRKSVDTKKLPYIGKNGDEEPYGLINYASTQFAYYNRIPDQFLSEASREAAGEGSELATRVSTVQRYFSEINNVYSHYAKAYQSELRKKERAAEKAAEKSAKSPKKKPKVEARAAASPKITAVSPKSSPKGSPKSSAKGKSPRVSPQGKGKSPRTSRNE